MISDKLVVDLVTVSIILCVTVVAYIVAIPRIRLKRFGKKTKKGDQFSGY